MGTVLFFGNPSKNVWAHRDCQTLKMIFQSELDHPLSLREPEVARGSNLTRQRVCRREQLGIVKLRMVERVKQLETKLHFLVLHNFEVLLHDQVPLVMSATL